MAYYQPRKIERVMQTELIPLTDSDPMPFGDHTRTPMSKVPARYLHWLWTNGLKDDPGHGDRARVHGYIQHNLSALKKEHPDGIW